MGARAADVKSCYLCENDSIRTGIFLLRARELHTPTTETGGSPPIPHFPPPSIYFTTLPARRHNSGAPFSLCCFDCSSFFIAPPAALRGLAICTVTGALRM